ncbi:MAG: GNAT family N-acetyltransferase [Pseudomonadota bacterium]
MEKITISDSQADIDFEFVYQFLSEQSIWASGVGRTTQRRALDNSLCISAFNNGKQVGFARVVTDYATFAWVDDVFVDEAVRGQGVAHQMISTILNHDKLQSVASCWLSSSNPVARALFAKPGFTRPDEARLDKLMAQPKRQNNSYKR